MVNEELVDKIIKIVEIMSKITNNSDKFTLRQAKKIISEFGEDPNLSTFHRTKRYLYIIYNNQKFARVKNSMSFSIPTELKYQYAKSIAKDQINNLMNDEILCPYLNKKKILI